MVDELLEHFSDHVNKVAVNNVYVSIYKRSRIKIPAYEKLTPFEQIAVLTLLFDKCTETHKLNLLEDVSCSLMIKLLAMEKIHKENAVRFLTLLSQKTYLTLFMKVVETMKLFDLVRTEEASKEGTTPVPQTGSDVFFTVFPDGVDMAPILRTLQEQEVNWKWQAVKKMWFVEPLIAACCAAVLYVILQIVPFLLSLLK